ncbi:hypothetical protein [Solitalea koreensis]|uniref:Uncharacterized protein n=1 Tax=Solitalea koreensis TaxID=543615 RepID=A0A521C9G3_9SPHI|nr:hypothetical protein [Solitalea koreensis]SMO56089.1 hypothetical protein SAMN06265350_103313 [Solitalea koreensis]
MKGINYITDDAGNKTAVVIDLNLYSEELEEFIEELEAQSRVSEPKVTTRL